MSVKWMDYVALECNVIAAAVVVDVDVDVIVFVLWWKLVRLYDVVWTEWIVDLLWKVKYGT